MKYAIRLIEKLLRYNPDQRLKPLDALKEPFFDELRDNPHMSLPNGNPLPKDLFKFREEEISASNTNLK